MSKETLERIAGLGAFGVCVVLLAIWALVVRITIPGHGAVGGGIDRTEATVTWVAVGLVILALVAVHVVYGRKLLAMARGERFTV